MRRFVLVFAVLALLLPTAPAVAAAPAGLGPVTGVTWNGDTVTVSVGADRLVVRALRADLVQVDYRPGGVSDPPTVIGDPAKVWGSGNLTAVDILADPITARTAKLTVRIARNPARLSIVDATGRIVLSEPASGGVHGDGVRFSHAPGEHFYGITGNPVSWAEHDPKQNLAEGMRRDDGGRVDANMQGDGGAPWAFTSRYGLLVDSVDGDFAISDTALEFTGVSKRNVTYYVAVAPPKDAMKALAEISGKPAMFPKWALGFSNSEWGTTQAEVEQIVRGYRDRNIPLDSFTLDFDFKAWGEVDYGEFRWNSQSGPGNVHPDKFPDGASGAFGRAMNDQGVQLVGIMKPRVIVEKAGGGATAQAQWARANNCFYPGRADYPEYFSQRLANDYDFAKQTCRDEYWKHAKALFGTGISGWWNDEADEAGGFVFNSLQHLNMERALYEGQRSESTKRVFSINRNYYLGAQRYGYGEWSGDISSGFASMADQRTRMLTAINVGESKWGMDIGGFAGDPSPENYARWMQFGAFVPIYRVHGGQDAQRQPWVYGPTAERAATEALRLRHALLPYIYAAERADYETGIGLVRPLFYDYPSDPTAANLTSEWMFGDSMLVAPVVEQGATSKRVYLPAGQWTDWFRGTVYTGPVTIDYPVDPVSWRDIPLFVKGGAVVPTTASATVEDLNVFPGSGSATVYDDDGASTAYEQSGYVKQQVSAVRSGSAVTVTAGQPSGSYASALRQYVVKINSFSGTGVSAGGSALPRFGSVEALRAAPGEGWATGSDQYGPYTAVKVGALAARTIVASGSAGAAPDTGVAQAQTAALTGGASVATDHSGYTGTGFVAGYQNQGATTAFTVSAAQTRQHTLTLRYANGTGSAKTLSMTVNGVRDQVTLPATANWDTWSTVALPVPLRAGGNTVLFGYGGGDSGNVNLDSLSVASCASSCPATFEAENATLTGGASLAADHAGYSGTGFVDGLWNSGASATFTVPAAAAGTVPLTLRYANATGSPQTLTLTVNGSSRQITLASWADWDTWSDVVTSVPLRAGTNTVSYSYGPAD
ncbi:MAG: hypothetical protein QOI74_434, partial [Micromonosporaceae bacterium]|nr:hypothetical protein [Micromonosporaceae bacterium]